MFHICLDESKFYFPAVDEADEDGLLLIGGKVTPERVIEAYHKGIFPWYGNGELPLWWSPDPRFVLFPDDLHVSKSMKKLFSKKAFDFKVNTAFKEVIDSCASVTRKEQNGTWLTQEMKDVYTQLHYYGYADSAEAWKDGKLVGGMYGIRLGHVFFGESMFSTEANASKFVLIKFVQYLKLNGVKLIDCQVYTSHVESLGARSIHRKDFLELLQNLVSR